MKCVNCGIAIQRLQRHLVSSLSARHQSRLSCWLSNAQTQLPLDALICQPCFLLLDTEAGEHERLLGHKMVCVGCGKSVRRIKQYHNVNMECPLLAVLISQNTDYVPSRNNYVCHMCWIRANRQAVVDSTHDMQELASDNMQDLASNNNAAAPPDVQEVSPPQPPPLPPFQSGPLQRETVVCETHLYSDQWHLLPQINRTNNAFSALHIEDIINLLKSKENFLNFENVSEMPNHSCHYWTGLTVPQFLILFNLLPRLNVKQPKRALAIYLIKLRTGDSNRRLSTLFNIPRTTLELIMKKVRLCLNEDFVPNNIGVNHINHNEIANRNLRFSHSLILKVRGGGTLIFPLWKRLTFKRLILTKNSFRNLSVFFKDLSIDTHHGY
ncbi:hypothetical protein SFRURICE_005465, partial [Spodoptera frugiperda]